MSAKSDNLLESGYWEEIDPNEKLSAYAHATATKWAPARAKTWTRQRWDSLRRFVRSSKSSPSKQLRRTAYLDGLRGFAAFLVYWHHHQLWAHDSFKQNPIYENAFGYEGKYYFAAFHGVRTFFTGGHFAVSVFFVISGYVLSAKPISLIQSGEYLKAGDNIGSALFRRWLRLYIPLICTTFLYMTLWHVFSFKPAAAEPERTWRDEVWKWYSEFKNFSFVFRSGGEPWFTYNFHLWSIPVEFKGSIVIYTSLHAFARCTRNSRLWCQLGLIFYFLYIADGWYCALFVAGMLLCDLDELAMNNNLPRFFWKLESFKELIFINLFAISIFLGGVPSHNLDLNILKKSPGWHYLSFLKPQAVFDYKWFYLFWAAVLLVASVPRIPSIKSFLETRFCQYLGRIAFALYLVHGPVLWSLGDRVYAAVGWEVENYAQNIPNWFNKTPLPQIGPLGMELSFLLPNIILLPVTLWVAEIVMRIFDEPSVKFAAWAYKKTMPRPVVKV